MLLAEVRPALKVLPSVHTAMASEHPDAVLAGNVLAEVAIDDACRAAAEHALVVDTSIGFNASSCVRWGLSDSAVLGISAESEVLVLCTNTQESGAIHLGAWGL